jgi:hypothetical protein
MIVLVEALLSNWTFRADHRRQRRSILGLGQVAFPRHNFYSQIR